MLLRSLGPVRSRSRVSLALLWILVMLTANAGVAFGQSNSASREFTTRARQAVLMDYETGSILFQSNSDELRPPASLSKLMTLAVVFKALKDGRLKLADEFLVSLNAWKRGGAPSRTTAMFVPLNTKAKLSDLLLGITVQTANDAAIAIAEGMAGNEDAFARLMTEEARAIGLRKSVFKNATGLPQEGHEATARDLALLARHLIREYPAYFQMFGQREFNYRRHKFVSRNPLLSDPTVDGMMAGGSAQTGFGFVVTSKGEERRLIAVLMGLSSENERRDEARRLLDYGQKGFSGFKLFDAGEVVGQARVWGGTAMYVPLSGDGDVMIMLPTKQAANQRLRAEIVYSAPLKPPIRRGDPVARLRVTSTSSAMSEVPLYAGEDVEAGSLLRRGLDSLTYMAFGWLQR